MCKNIKKLLIETGGNGGRRAFRFELGRQQNAQATVSGFEQPQLETRKEIVKLLHQPVHAPCKHQHRKYFISSLCSSALIPVVLIKKCFSRVFIISFSCLMLCRWVNPF